VRECDKSESDVLRRRSNARNDRPDAESEIDRGKPAPKEGAGNVITKVRESALPTFVGALVERLEKRGPNDRKLRVAFTAGLLAVR
jgi:hypothetical protein